MARLAGASDGGAAGGGAAASEVAGDSTGAGADDADGASEGSVVSISMGDGSDGGLDLGGAQEVGTLGETLAEAGDADPDQSAYLNSWARRIADVGADDVRLSRTPSLDGQVQVDATRKPYTVMVYMIGSNLESTVAAGTHDLAEMRSSGVDFDKANVIVYAGGSKRWNTAIPAERNSVLDLSLPEDDCIVAQTEESQSMGASGTLTSFLEFCCQNYPAEHFALVLWDHGGGPLWGYGSDELHDGDGLVFSEIREALDRSPFATDGTAHLDWAGFDACLMGSLESCTLLRDYADVLIASEEVEPGDGWDYAFLEELNATTDAAKIARAVLSSYKKHYDRSANTLSNPDVTLAAYDLAQVDKVTDALDDLAERMGANLTRKGYASINRARHSAKAFGLTAASSRADGYDLVDLVDLAARLEDAYPKEAAALQKAAQRLVIDSVSNVAEANGVALYFPGENRELYETLDGRAQRAVAAADDTADGTGDAEKDDAGDAEKDDAGDAEKDDAGKDDAAAASPDALAAPADGSDPYATTFDDLVAQPTQTLVSEGFDRFVEDYANAWLDTSTVDWTLAEVAQTDDGPTLQLSDRQADALSAATYTVLQELSAGTYCVRTSSVEIEVADDGVVRVPADPLLIAPQTDLLGGHPMWFNEVERTDQKAVLSSSLIYLGAAGDYTGLDTSRDPQATASIEVDLATDEVSVTSLLIQDGQLGTGGKATVDVDDYATLYVAEYNGGNLLPAYDEADAIRPWSEWGGDAYLWSTLPLDESFGFVAKPASAFGGTYYAQIVLTDVNGVRHATEPVPLPTGERPEASSREVIEDTELGTLTYTVYDDHAELTGYEGDDWTVRIAGEVGDVPVTAIANNAFHGARYLDELVVPEGITSIGSRAFASSGLYALTLPSTLAYVAPAAFGDMEHLEAFALSGQSPAVSVRDGVLFSADGQTLIAYPNAKGAEYAVPEGTKELGYGCFAETDVREVTLPKGLTQIGRAAFYDCASLRSANLPRSLERIGSVAFGYSGALYGTLAPLDHLELGPNVSFVGDDAFLGLALTSIEVDEKNPTYTARDGFLLNAAGDVVVAAPQGMGNVVQVPDGVVALGAYALSDYPDGTEFILPDSLERLEETTFPHSYVFEDTGKMTSNFDYRCVLHASEGSYAWHWATDREIACDSLTDRTRLVFSEEVVQADDVTLTFRVYGDRAVLVSTRAEVDWSVYSPATSHELVIPAEVGGQPVTAIDTNPTYAGDYASTASTVGSITSLELPSTLQMVGTYGLSDFYGLKRISFGGGDPTGNGHFGVVDDVLLAADGSTLVAYPAAKTGAYEVPAGVETIASYAFYGAKGLGEVKLPGSVEQIGDCAFNGCTGLAHVSFGRGLERIGAQAFYFCTSLVLDAPLPDALVSVGNNAFMGIGSVEGLEVPEYIEFVGANAFGTTAEEMPPRAATSTLTLGSYVAFVGLNAFDGIAYEAFEVDGDNEAYRADGPFLLSADGRDVVAFACGSKGEVHVPDGVRTLNLRTLCGAWGISDLYVPASVRYISGERTEQAIQAMRIHVVEGSYGARFAQEKGLSWVVE